MTIPPSVGYEQNPLSLYYCYDLEESSKRLSKCIAQVYEIDVLVVPLFLAYVSQLHCFIVMKPYGALALWY